MDRSGLAASTRRSPEVVNLRLQAGTAGKASSGAPISNALAGMGYAATTRRGRESFNQLITKDLAIAASVAEPNAGARVIDLRLEIFKVVG